MPDQAGLAYLAGLCHDLGEIFIRTEFGNEYQQVLDAAARTGRAKEQLQGKMLGMTPMQMTGAVLKCMGLPDAIREPIVILHSPRVAATTDPVARILWLAENYANAVTLASGPGAEVAAFTRSFCNAAMGDPNPKRPDPKALRSEVLSLTVMLARLSRADEAKLLAPMFETQPTRVWIARHPGVSEFDPISLFLESFTEVVIHNRLPVDGEAEGIDRLVVISPSVSVSGFSPLEIELAIAKQVEHGRALPVLAICCEEALAIEPSGGVSWRTSVALGAVATFVAAQETDKRAA